MRGWAASSLRCPQRSRQLREEHPLKDLVLAAGVVLGYYEFLLAVEQAGSGWLVGLVGKGQRRRVACRQPIDCTGGADVVGALGLARLRKETIQPGTMIFELDGCDLKQLDAQVIQQRYEEALREGRLKPGDYAKSARTRAMAGRDRFLFGQLADHGLASSSAGRNPRTIPDASSAVKSPRIRAPFEIAERIRGALTTRPLMRMASSLLRSRTIPFLA